MAINLGTIFAQIGLDTSLLRAGVSKANAQLVKAERGIGGFIRRNQKVMLGFGAAGVAAVGAIGVASIKMAGDFDQAMRNVNTITRVTEEQFNEMKDAVVDLSREVPFTAKELSDGLFQVASAGVEAAEQMNFLKISAQAATAGQAEMGSTVKGLTGVLKAYGLGFEEVERISDLFFKTNELGVTTFQELADNMGSVAPIAAALSVDVEELFGAMATLTGVTGNTSEVVTQLRGVFTSLIKPSSEAAKEAERLGLSFDSTSIQTMGLGGFLTELRDKTGGNTETMGKLFGNVRALNGIMALSGPQFDNLITKMDAMENSTGAMTEAFSEQQKGLNNQLDLFKNNISAIAIEIGTDLIPALNDVLAKFNEMDQEQKDLITTGSKYGLGIIGASSLVLLLSVGISKLTTFIKTNASTLQKFSSGPLAQFAVGFLAARQASEAFAPAMKEHEDRVNSLIPITTLLNDKNRIAAVEQRILTDELSTTGGVMARLLGVTEDHSFATDQISGLTKNFYNAQNDLTESTENVTEVIADENKVLIDQKEIIDDLLSSVFELFNLNQDVVESTFSYNDAMEDLNQAIRENGEGSREAQEAAFDLQDARENLVAAIFEEIQATDISIKRQSELRTEFIKVGQDAVRSGEITEEAFRQMLSEFDNTVRGVGTGVATIKRSLDGIPRKITVEVDVNYNQRILALEGAPSRPGFYTGGEVRGFEAGGVIRGYANGGGTSQRTVLVGERGPELARLPLGTRISANNNLNQALRDNQTQGDIVIPVTVELDGQVLYESNQRIENQEEFRRVN